MGDPLPPSWENRASSPWRPPRPETNAGRRGRISRFTRTDERYAHLHGKDAAAAADRTPRFLS